MVTVVIVGGTAGTGKSTVGVPISEQLHTLYIEGDDIHPAANIEKMSKNIPLTDEDRWGWLEQVAKQSTEAAEKNENHIAVVSCSALKKVYRDKIQSTAPETKFLYLFLYTTKEELIRRTQARQNHFMKSSMLDSQFSILELPENEPNALIVDVTSKSVDEIVQKSLKFVKSQI